MTALDTLADTWRRARRVVVLTGAGLSTASGIPDFRSPGGARAVGGCQGGAALGGRRALEAGDHLLEAGAGRGRPRPLAAYSRHSRSLRRRRDVARRWTGEPDVRHRRAGGGADGDPHG